MLPCHSPGQRRGTPPRSYRGNRFSNQPTQRQWNQNLELERNLLGDTTLRGGDIFELIRQLARIAALDPIKVYQVFTSLGPENAENPARQLPEILARLQLPSDTGSFGPLSTNAQIPFSMALYLMTQILPFLFRTFLGI